MYSTLPPASPSSPYTDNHPSPASHGVARRRARWQASSSEIRARSTKEARTVQQVCNYSSRHASLSSCSLPSIYLEIILLSPFFACSAASRRRLGWLSVTVVQVLASRARERLVLSCHFDYFLFYGQIHSILHRFSITYENETILQLWYTTQWIVHTYLKISECLHSLRL